MKVILVYDINTEDDEGKRILQKIKKIARKYLHHVQKSVFEGDLTLSKISALKMEIGSIIRRRVDSVIIYTFPESINIKREILSEVSDPLDNII
jgi:CRISPR-associated protein Cas2